MFTTQPARRGVAASRRAAQPTSWGLAALVSAFFLSAATGCTREAQLFDHLDANRAALHQPASNSGKVVHFEIEPGTPARTIAESLADAGLILDAELLEGYVRSIGRAGQLKAGTFLLRADMSPVEIVDALLADRAAGIVITVPEGWRLEQVSDHLNASGLNLGDAYLRMAQAPKDGVAGSGDSAPKGGGSGGDLERWPFLRERPGGGSLEGFLFPATYQLPAVNPAANDLIARQLDAFAERIVPLYERALADGQNPPPLYEVLILASIVEREAVVPMERQAIAGVLLNRLAEGMTLDIDATVQYAMGYQPESGQWWKTPLFMEEYQRVHSPYNTYMHAGLPPGPIASPGEDSFRAALYPDKHRFFFYVAAPDGEGTHVFAETYEQHLENVQRYLDR